MAQAHHDLQKRLQGVRVAILATDGFEMSELIEPRNALLEAGAHVEIVSPKKGQIEGWQHFERGEMIKVDRDLESVDSPDYDALVLPGGVANPDQLRMNVKAVNFVSHFVQEEKPIAAICHGPWTLIEAEGVEGRTLTSWPSLHTDLVNAGAKWVDREVVRDGQLVTSRNPDDLPAFNREMIEAIAEYHAGTASRNRARTEVHSAAPSAQI